MERASGFMSYRSVVFGNWACWLSRAEKSRRFRISLICVQVLSVIALCGLLFITRTAQSEVIFTVNSTADERDAAAGDGNCISIPSGACTLRAAIMEANALAGDDIINLPAGTYTLTIPGTNEDAGLTGDLDITSSLTINGAGMLSTIVSANGIDRVFDIMGTATVTISGVTIANGQRVLEGGGLRYSYSDLVLKDSTIEYNHNTPRYSGGGGVANSNGRLTISNCLISNNGGAWVGGGVYSWFGTVQIINSTIISNSVTGNGGYNRGGGIYNNWGWMTVVSSTVTANQAGWGGGIENEGWMTVKASIISDNIANTSSGGIENYRWLTVTESLISGNRAISGEGGGLYNLLNAQILSSTITDNHAVYFGGGIRNQGLITITASTISGNEALYGGGVGNFGLHVRLINSTLSNNTAIFDGGGLFHYEGTRPKAYLSNVTIFGNTAGGDGGGIAVGSLITLSHVIIGGNVDTGGEANDCAGDFYSLGYNLIQDDMGCGITGATAQDIISRDPILGPLQDNGGPTFTHALLPGSPAIDAGNPAAPGSSSDACELTDQRGIIRPQRARCDIGAVEFVGDINTIYLPFILGDE